jgi:hypothetical protein
VVVLSTATSQVQIPGSRTVMPFLVTDLKILLVHFVVAVVSKKRLVLDLNTAVEND